MLSYTLCLFKITTIATIISSISSDRTTMSPPTTPPTIGPAGGGATSTTFPSVVVKSIPSVLSSKRPVGELSVLASMGLVGGIPC